MARDYCDTKLSREALYAQEVEAPVKIALPPLERNAPSGVDEHEDRRSTPAWALAAMSPQSAIPVVHPKL